MARGIVARDIPALIHLVRGRRVMLDADLADLYGVNTKQLNRAVTRNKIRFPDDFMFQLSFEEVRDLRCQFGTSKDGRGGRRYRPYVFTEQGVAMLSSVLQSKEAALINIQIVRAFVALREAAFINVDLARKLEQLEYRVGHHDDEIAALFEAIKQLMLIPTPQKKNRISF